MQQFLNHILGNHNLAFHLAGLLFSFFGTLIAKGHFWQKHKAQCEGVHNVPKFKIGKWLQENTIQIVESLLISFVTVRFIDVLLLWLNPKIELAFNFTIPVTTDQVFYYFITGIMVQLWIHKKYFSKKWH